MIRARLTWTGPIVTGGAVSTLYSQNDVGDAQDFIDGIETFMSAIADRLNNNQVWELEDIVDEVDISTGNILSQASVTTTANVGTDATEALPTAIMGLVQARTGAFLGGREVRGRIFIPGFTETQSPGGAPSSACRSDVGAAAVVLANSTSAQWCIYSRTNHAAVGVSTALMWNKWAVLRSRRD